MIAEIIDNLTKFPEAVAPYLSLEYFKLLIQAVSEQVASSGVSPILYPIAYPLMFLIGFPLAYWPVVVVLIGAIAGPIADKL